jgi:hypothetical protein
MLSSLLAIADPEADLQFLEFDSPYLEQLRQLTDEGNYAGVEELCNEMAESGIFDVRILLVGMYAQTLENPLVGLSRVVEDLEILFGEAWPIIGPAEKKNKYAKGSLAWLLKQIRVDLDSQKVEETDLWKTWISGEITREELANFLAAIDEVKREIIAILEDDSDAPLQAFTDLIKWLKELSQLIPESPGESEELQEDSGDESTENKPSSVDQRGFMVGEGNGNLPQVQGSYHVQLLIQKMELFRFVVQKGDLLKAAIVASDMNEILTQFDPKKYFPELFSEYLYVMAGDANRISDAMEMRDTPQWQVLTELYKIDMAKFAKVKTDLL